MVYRNNFVAAVKVSGEILREKQNQVVLPFGSEFSILLKNLNTVRALVTVQIDGADATDGTQLIVGPNSSLDLERFIRNGNFNSGNRFKFIERTSEIENHRGIKSDDGLIRVEYRFEKKPEKVEHILRVYHDEFKPAWVTHYPHSPLPYTWYNGAVYNSSTSLTGNASSRKLQASAGREVERGGTTSTTGSAIHANSVTMSWSSPQNEQGITVAGSESGQKFVSGSWFATEPESHAIVLQLVGRIAGKSAAKPVLTSTKLSCPTCGRKNKSSFQFCGGCGTALKVI